MANTKKLSPTAKVLAALTAAAVAVLPLTQTSEGLPATKTKTGVVYKAYLDPVKIPTICYGRTKGVKMGDVATKAQCDEYLRQDMLSHMGEALAMTPTLIENKHALMAAGDFAFNAGATAWGKSPMHRLFMQKKWKEGCNAFRGYYNSATFATKPARYVCKPRAGQPGKWLCELPGLTTRREREANVCLTGVWS